MMLKSFYSSILFFFISINLWAQIDTTNENYKAFFNSDGILISEGFLEDGKPNGYWINYYENGEKKSEGNRKNFELDGTWKFYDEEGFLKNKIQYKNGKKDGVQEAYENGYLVKKEEYINDTIVGRAYTYYPDSSQQVKTETPYKNSLKDGIAFRYSKDGRLIELITYTRGFLKDREEINQLDEQGRKQGIWKTYYENNRLKQETRYKDGKLNGYEKNYTADGKLHSATLYISGEIQDNEENIADFEVRNEYYPSGKIKRKITYNLSGEKDGIEKLYDEEGNIIASFLFKNGFLLAEGIVDDKGWYQGDWKHY